ncbi:MAG: O-antigen ligase family protein, partial [Phormidesmis sp. RL_2_1]|nr:O-antigen ligase family protein [Phormidesmis sp. RL_2_1]
MATLTAYRIKNIFFWSLLAVVFTSFLWSDFPDITQRRSLAILETTIFALYFASRFNLKEQLKILAFTGSLFAIISLLFSLAIPAQAIESGIHAGAWRGPLIQKNLFARVLVLFCIASYLDRSPSKLSPIR